MLVPLVSDTLKSTGQLVRKSNDVRKADDLDLGGVDLLKEMSEESADRMGSEIAREKADAKWAIQ